MNFKGKIVVITGASRGLGKCLAVSFVKRGAKVVVSARGENELKRVADEIGAVPIVCDVTNEEQVKNLVAETVKRFGRLDVMVNNAGILAQRVAITELNSEDVHNMMEVNFFGTMYGSKFALIEMSKNKSGTIVNIISTSGLNPRSGSVGYATTKFAASGFTRGLALEALPLGIKVIGVYPSTMKTDIFKYQSQLPADYNTYMDPEAVVEKIVTHLEKENPESELVIGRL